MKPYELIDGDSDGYKGMKTTKKVMMEDGLEDVENLMEPEKKT